MQHCAFTQLDPHSTRHVLGHRKNAPQLRPSRVLRLKAVKADSAWYVDVKVAILQR